MTFPQLDSNLPAINGYQFFRLNTPLSSSGDIYESEQSALAFALGPNSDIANVRVSFFNDTIPGGVDSIVLSPDRAFVGRVAARNEVKYIKSNTRRGRILISTDDIYDPNYVPSGFTLARDSFQTIHPIIDVIQYFINPPSLSSMRSDRTQRLQYFVNNSLGAQPSSAFVGIPAYGRKSGCMSFLNVGNGVNDVAVSVIGVKFSTSGGLASPTTGTFERTLTTQIIPVGTQGVPYIFKSSVDGLWDMFVVRVGGNPLNTYAGGPFPISVTLSDDLQ